MQILTQGLKQAAKRGVAYILRRQLQKEAVEQPKIEESSPTAGKEEATQDPPSTTFQDAEIARREAREAINANPEKAEGRSLGGMEKMENAKSILENPSDHKLDSQLEEIREEGIENRGKSWVERTGSEKQDSNKSWLDRVSDEKLDNTEGANYSESNKVGEGKTDMDTQEIPEANPSTVLPDPSVETPSESPIDINPDITTDKPDVSTDIDSDPTTETPDVSDDRSDNSDYNQGEPNEFALLEARETNFFSNESSTVDLTTLNDQDMYKFSDLARDKEYSYEGDDKEDLDNSNELENESVNDWETISFNTDDNQIEMDDMDMGDDGGDV